MPPTIDFEMVDIEMADASSAPLELPPYPPILPHPRTTTPNTSKARTPPPDPTRVQQAMDVFADSPAKLGKKLPERLLQTMDELDLYRQWSRFKKSMVARAQVSKDKAALHAFFNDRQAKIGVTDDQIRRFKRLYDLVHQCDVLHANDRQLKRELRSPTKETHLTAIRGVQGKKTGQPLDWEERSSP